MKRLLLFISALVVISCGEEPQKADPLNTQELIALNKERHIAEMTWIRNYVTTLHMPMNEGATGFFYCLIEAGEKKLIASGDEIEIDYHIYQLTHPAFTEKIAHDKKKIHVENDNSESGIHQALRLMSKGDSAIFIMPSHLAFGLTGNHLVNPNTPLLYTIRVLPDDRNHEKK
jgi:hypothetical protein